MTDPTPAPGGTGFGKLYAGTTASVLAGAITTVIIAIINGIDPSYHMTDLLQGSIQTLVSAAITAIAIYAAPHGA